MHKKRTVSVSHELFDLSNADENFLKNIITGDKTWVCGYGVEKKSAVVTMDGKIVATTKKSTSESLKCEGDVDSFF